MRYLFLRLTVTLATFGIGVACSSFHTARCHAEMPLTKGPDLPLEKEQDVFATGIVSDCSPAFEKSYFNYD
jgi:hypothetical protein